MEKKWSKKFFWFFFFFLEINFRRKKFGVFSKICEKLFFTGKKSNFKFKIGGIFGKKVIKKVSLIFFFFRNKLQAKKIWRILENLRKTFFLPEKNPTSSWKIGGISKKWVKFPIGSRHFFPRKKCSLIFMKIYRNEV